MTDDELDARLEKIEKRMLEILTLAAQVAAEVDRTHRNARGAAQPT